MFQEPRTADFLEIPIVSQDQLDAHGIRLASWAHAVHTARPGGGTLTWRLVFWFTAEGILLAGRVLVGESRFNFWQTSNL